MSHHTVVLLLGVPAVGGLATWRPLQDVLTAATLATQQQVANVHALSRLSASDAQHLLWHSVRSAVASTPHKTHYLYVDEPGGHLVGGAMPAGHVVLPQLDSNDEAAPYRRGELHTYDAADEQLARIAGDEAGSKVSKIVVERADGSTYSACVPRDPSVDLIVVAKNRKGGTNAWLVRDGDEEGGTDSSDSLRVRHEMTTDSDLIYDKLERGAHLHCCGSKGEQLEQSVVQSLAEEALMRGEDARTKLREWQQKGCIHTECMCRKAAEAAEDAADP